MPRTMLNDQHWSKLQNIFRQFNIYLKPNLRNFVEAILFRIRTGCPWRDLPSEFGNSNSIFQKFNRWSSNEKLVKIFKLFANNADIEWIFIDGSHVRAHQHSSGRKDQDISKSIGGNSSKIHLAVDSNGNPIEFIISDGTTHDMKIAPTLVQQLDLSETETLCADKGYDSESLRVQIQNTVNSHQNSRHTQPSFDGPFHNLMENADHWNHFCVLNYRTSQHIQRYLILLQF